MSGLDPFEHDDAAYVLGSLDDGDRAAFEAHLRSCDACAHRVELLAPLGPALAGLAPADVATLTRPIDAVPATLLPGLLRRAGGARRRRRRVTAGLSGLAAACAALAAVALWPSQPASSRQPADGRPQAMSALVTTPLEATAALVDTPWGTRISLDCRYANNPAYPAAPLTYSLTVVDASGTHQQLGSWTVKAGTPTEFTSGTALHRADIRAIDIARPDGTPVLALAL